MKAFLMYRDHDFDLQQELPWNAQALTQDLHLNTLFNVMAGSDKYIFDVAAKAVLSSITDLDTIFYRQDILKDCLKNPSIVRNIYNIAVESIEKERKTYWGSFSKYPPAILGRAIEVLQLFVENLRKLRRIADEHAGQFTSEGFTTLFAMLRKELDDAYFAEIQDHLEELKLRDGVLISASLGKGNKGINYVLRKTPHSKWSWLNWILERRSSAYTVYISNRDNTGARVLGELRDRGINLVANALAQSTDHILDFFKMLRAELAFYIGCVNLSEKLVQKGEPISFPTPVGINERQHSFRGLYDISLSLSQEQGVVGNDIDANNKCLVIVTGANQGGKSTFLRSVGLAQLMMQCGMFTPSDTFCANVCERLFTHFKREEDLTMKSGKLDEELSRMSIIADHITSDSMVLFNESFAATNEREGSEIARQIIGALVEKRVKVFFVTHLYEFAHGFYSKKPDDIIFLRAERQDDGSRTFKVSEGEPLQTSFGEDLYLQIFEDAQ